MARRASQPMRGSVAGSDFIAAVMALVLMAPVMAAEAAPRRVMSLDYCADQFVLALADPEQIAALSRDATSERSYYAERARAHRLSGASAEEVLMTDPDLVISVWGGGYRGDDLMRRFGIASLRLDFPRDIEGVRDSLRRVGRALAQEGHAAAIIAEMDRRLGAVRDKWHAADSQRLPLAAYVTPGGVTSGRGTLVHEALVAAGLRNLAAEAGSAGWQTIDLERLVMVSPDVMVVGFHDLAYNVSNPWRLGRHASLRALMESRPTAYVDSRILACPTWFFVDAVEDLYTQLVAPRLKAILAGRP